MKIIATISMNCVSTFCITAFILVVTQCVAALTRRARRVAGYKLTNN